MLKIFNQTLLRSMENIWRTMLQIAMDVIQKEDLQGILWENPLQVALPGDTMTLLIPLPI